MHTAFMNPPTGNQTTTAQSESSRFGTQVMFGRSQTAGCRRTTYCLTRQTVVWRALPGGTGYGMSCRVALSATAVRLRHLPGDHSPGDTFTWGSLRSRNARGDDMGDRPCPYRW